jgi:hypothetical protein
MGRTYQIGYHGHRIIVENLGFKGNVEKLSG